MHDNYVTYHLHSDLSLLDSTTNFQDYINKAVELGQTAICFTEHGNIYQWVEKKLACDAAGLKYLHGVECYLTEKLVWEDVRTGETSKLRDNYHTILIAKNEAGIRELNQLVSISSREDHFYYKPRISFQEFFGISKNVIKISACLASPLNKLEISHPLYEKLVKSYDYLEIQPHDFPNQLSYNCHLATLSQKYGIPLIAGTDTHSLNTYKAECRTLLMLAKGIDYADEDTFDLTYKSYDELVEMFEKQDALPEKLYLEAIENTNRMADSVESFELDTAFKYPYLYGEKDGEVLQQTIQTNFEAKIAEGAITQEQIEPFKAAIAEECQVFDKINMSGFMLFMSEMVTWCKSHGIPVGFNRGSCGGSRVAYITNIIDMNPETWHTVFSRFANVNRKELGDIDIDVAPNDRDKVYEYIINRFGEDKTAYILAVGTIKAKGCVDEIVRALGRRWDKENLHDTKKVKAILKELKSQPNTSDTADEVTFYLDELKRMNLENEKISSQNPWIGKIGLDIKNEFEADETAARQKYPEVFYYFDGLVNVAVSQSMHPAGIVASPISLSYNYGTLYSDGKKVLQIDMDCVHAVNLVKYDILGLKNIGIIKDAHNLIGKPYPKSHEVDWNDKAVWDDMLRSPIGIFQFEGDFAYKFLKQYKPQSILDLSMITAVLRPGGASIRDDFMAHKVHENPSPEIDALLAKNNGFLIFQEDVTNFLQEICGFSGSEADSARRAICHKDEAKVQAVLPTVLEGYCKNSPRPREIAEEEAKEFIQVIRDASNYMFNYSHATGYSMLSYLCAYLRYYHPYEFITAFLNNADNQSDIENGSELAVLYSIKIVPPKFGLSCDKYMFDTDSHVIAKGLSSIKYMNKTAANELYTIAKERQPETFMEVLRIIENETSVDSRQLKILIQLDFFKDFGNITELNRVLAFFELLKNGQAKKIAKDKLDEQVYKIVAQFSTDVNKNGTIAKTFTIVDMNGLLNACEKAVKALKLPDMDIKFKMQAQKDYLGYIDLTTNCPEDRRKLLVTDVYPLKTKGTGAIWGYATQTRSIGTGKTARLTIRANTYNHNPIKQYNIIWAEDLSKNNRGYWYLLKYKLLA